MCLNPKPVKFETYRKIDEKTGEIIETKRPIFLPVNPLHTYNEETEYLPCGRCSECKVQKSKDWATRAYLESLKHSENAFLTLTYDDTHRPQEKSLKKADLQKFFKRLRKAGYKFSYMACGEYGSTTGREHYHIATFGYWPPDAKIWSKNEIGDWLYVSEELNRIWGQGYCIIGKLTFESAAYIARYVQKKAYTHADAHLNDNAPARAQEFILTSKRPAIAKEIDIKLENILNGFIVKTKQGAKCLPVPQYNMAQIKKENRTLYNKIKKIKRQRIVANRKDVLSRTDLNHEQYTAMTAKEKEKSLKRLDNHRTII